MVNLYSLPAPPPQLRHQPPGEPCCRPPGDTTVRPWYGGREAGLRYGDAKPSRGAFVVGDAGAGWPVCDRRGTIGRWTGEQAGGTVWASDAHDLRPAVGRQSDARRDAHQHCLQQCGAALAPGLPVHCLWILACLLACTRWREGGREGDRESTHTCLHVSTGPATAHARQDLVYYESPPAIQLLHCLRFDETIQGGATTFVDAVAVAETLRLVDPEAFHVLTKVPATFQKIHYDRPEPVHLVYRRPHISVNNAGDVIGVFWAPSFEGALLVPRERVCEYFRAYRKFANLLEGRQEEGSLRTEGDSKIRLRLKPGQLVAFNNRRMVHGRDAFEDTGKGGRHLQGCYLSMEVFANRCLVSPTIRNMRVYPVHTYLIMHVSSYVCKSHVYMSECNHDVCTCSYANTR